MDIHSLEFINSQYAVDIEKSKFTDKGLVTLEHERGLKRLSWFVCTYATDGESITDSVPIRATTHRSKATAEREYNKRTK